MVSQSNSIIEHSEINLKKIKYKLKNVSYDEYIKNYTNGCYKTTINCSYDFLLSQFGKPYITEQSINNKIRASWYLKVKTSINNEYYIDIYDWENDDVELNNVNKWNIAGKIEHDEYLNYDKLTKLLIYQFYNFNKKQEKERLKHEQQFTRNDIKCILDDKHQYIDIDKYKQINDNKLKEFSDDDLACVLFTRFKESSNPLFKNALVIHRELSTNTNIMSLNSNEFINIPTTTETTPTFIEFKKPINKSINSIIKKNKTKYNNKKDKTKYNNKKDKTKYNNKKDKI